MDDLSRVFAGNRAWAEARRGNDPEFFADLSREQRPNYLWIGCADSRVPANEITGLSAGELFVHRNVGNVVGPSDINCLSVLQYGVDVLGVRHIIVCGHYGCGGVKAALSDEPLGLVDAWLARIREVGRQHRALLDRLPSSVEQEQKLCALNVVEQAVSACYAPAVQLAWRAGQPLTVHGLVYDLEDGLLRETGFSASGVGEIEACHAAAIAKV